jgi:hypothetical protein
MSVNLFPVVGGYNLYYTYYSVIRQRVLQSNAFH